jgi:hypothetical protein
MIRHVLMIGKYGKALFCLNAIPKVIRHESDQSLN